MDTTQTLKRVRRLFGFGALAALIGGWGLVGWALLYDTWSAQERMALLILPMAWPGLLVAAAVAIPLSTSHRRLAGALFACSVAVLVGAGWVLRSVG